MRVVALLSLLVVACGGPRSAAASPSPAPTPSASSSIATRLVEGRTLATWRITNERNGPIETTNRCYTARYTALGYEVSFKNVCSAPVVSSETLGEDLGEAPSLRISVDVTFLSPPERASTADVLCLYGRGGGSWSMAYGFVLSPDGTTGITRWIYPARESTSLAVTTTPVDLKLAAPATLSADCAQVGGALRLTFRVNGIDVLTASDDVAPGRPATFGGAAVGFAGAIGFRAALTNLRVTELRPAQ